MERPEEDVLYLETVAPFRPVAWKDLRPGDPVYYVTEYRDPSDGRWRKHCHGPFVVVDPAAGELSNLNGVSIRFNPAKLQPLRLVPADDDPTLKALRRADFILFDVYSNSQKMDWRVIEAMCLAGCRETRRVLKMLGREQDVTKGSAKETLLEVAYRCPDCDHEWTEEWTSACDSECPYCLLKDVTALKFRPAGSKGEWLNA